MSNASSSNNRIGVRELKVSAAFEKIQLGTSSRASSSNNDLHEGDISFMGGKRSYASVVASCPPSGPKSSSKQTTQEKSPEDECENVVKNESCTQKLEYPSEATGKGDDYQNQRNSVSDYFRRKAELARYEDSLAEAEKYEKEARIYEKKPLQSTQWARQAVLDLMAEGVTSRKKINLCGQRLEYGMMIFKKYLIDGVYRSPLTHLKVITGYGNVRSSVLKKAIVDLLRKEKIEWQERKGGSLLITLLGKRELSFVECGEDSD